MKIFFLPSLVLSAIVFINASPAIAKSTKSYHFEPIVSQLSGTVEWRKYSDSQPPYFGEGKDPEGNPAPEVNVLVLIPDRPIDVIGSKCICPDEDSFQNVGIIELKVFNDPDNGDEYLGRHVNVSGYLFERETGFEYTDVLLEVKSIIPDSR